MTLETDRTLNEVLLSVSVQEALEVIGRHYGIDYVTFHMVSNVKENLDNPFVRTTYPTDWVSHYLLNNFVVIDPVLKNALQTEKPFCWDTLEHTPESLRIIEEAAKFGLGAQGFSVPYTDSQGRRSVLSVNSHLNAAQWSDFLEDYADKITNLASDVHVKAVSEAFADTNNIPHLSPREIECLKRTSEGKSHTEIAKILDLSEHTIRSYLKIARIKLDGVSLAQAVAKASRYGFM